MTVGERIRAARRARGLTQKALGEACGIAEPTIRRYELGKLNPKYGTLGKIAAALDTSASELMGIGVMPPELLEKKYRERERLAEELGLQVSPGPGAHLSELIQKGLPDSELDFLGDVEALSAVQKCFRELGFSEMHPASGETEEDTVALFNSRTGQVFIVSYDRYIDALEAVLHSSKEELSRLLEGAEESLSYREARGRGYEDVLGAAGD